HTIEKRQGMKVACLEEVAYRKGWLSKEQVSEQATKLAKNDYGRYLRMLINE
ncbi:glucose-1-phosphate thymidylyltransferase, partial [Klebsiella pneumoniae]|nr:glucose-1-phosphate thymidylyltransferase [Klebsiella pneumoniae]